MEQIMAEEFFDPFITTKCVMEKMGLDEEDMTYTIMGNKGLNENKKFNSYNVNDRNAIMKNVIADLAETDIPFIAIGYRYNVSKSTVSRVYHHEIYTDLSDGVEFRKRSKAVKRLKEYPPNKQHPYIRDAFVENTLVDVVVNFSKVADQVADLEKEVSKLRKEVNKLRKAVKK